jgi:hypothetical protein
MKTQPRRSAPGRLHWCALALATLALPLPLAAQPRAHYQAGVDAPIVKPAAAVQEKSLPSHVAREGGVERRLWLDTGHVAEFGGDGAPRIREAAPDEIDASMRTRRPDAASTAVSASAKSPVTGPAPVPASPPPDAAARGVATVPLSPVFRDASGQPRALPGGVIVSLEEALPEAQAREHLAAAGLVPLRQIGERMWVVDSPAGIESLELANRLQAEGGFRFAQPNWWTPKATK